MQKFFLFFHLTPAETRLSFSFHQPFFSPYNYSYHIPVSPILFLCLQCRDDIRYDCPIHILSWQFFSTHLNVFAWIEKMQLCKKLLLVLTNQERELHCLNVR